MATHAENLPGQSSVSGPLKALPYIEHSVVALKNGAEIPFLAEDDIIHSTILKSTRVLIADLCQQFAGGHPGSAMPLLHDTRKILIYGIEALWE